jgi:hypothetical protein
MICSTDLRMLKVRNLLFTSTLHGYKTREIVSQQEENSIAFHSDKFCSRKEHISCDERYKENF